jgi:arylsulfatase A-like enzyme
MNRSNVLVVVVDGLRASALGAYGNTTFATPALDEFAADSYLLDFCYAPATELGDNYRALWHSAHPLRPPEADANVVSLPQCLSNYGYTTTLVTDDSELRSFSATRHFDRIVETAPLETPHGHRSTAADIAQTALARLFADTCELIESKPHLATEAPGQHHANSPQLIWVHSRGMYGPWDAPLEFQRALLDEGDPPPLEPVTPPDLILDEAGDPDTAFRYSCAYAAQVMVFDACWRGLMDTIAARSAQESWLIVLLGARGFPLGEHQWVGGVDPRLYGEQLHVPFLVRFPDGAGKLARSAALTSHIDLLPTLAAFIGAELCAPTHYDGSSIVPLVSKADSEWRDALLSTSASSKSLRTASWCVRHGDDVTQSEQSDGVQLVDELFVCPDDHWEANDVAKLCHDVVHTLVRVTADLSGKLKQNQPLPVKILPETGFST